MQFHRADPRGLPGMVRVRLNSPDAFILFAVLCAGALFAFEFDFFENVDHMTSRERRITVEEFFALTGLLIAGLIVFAFRGLQRQKREFARRLAAEISAAEARHLAMRDPLTGLLNRRALLEAITASLDRAGDTRSNALLLFDLNGFKGINDRYGHPVGDQVLETIARRMESIAGHAHNVVARLGGDEFAVFCRSIRDHDDARRIAQELVTGIEAPIEIAGIRHSVGTGAGIALYPRDALTVEEMLRCADVALYRAKAEAQSAVHFYG